MAKKITDLTFLDIVLNADTETIQQALEARKRIDALLQEREEAYRRIAELEEEIESVVGEEGAFAFPEPPMMVAGYTAGSPSVRKAKPAPKAAPKPKKIEEPDSDEATDAPVES